MPDPKDWEPVRTVRVPNDLWRRANAKARANGTTLSALIRAWLRVYVGRDDMH